MNIWKIYKNTDIGLKNADFDDVEAFLNRFNDVISITDGQYVKHALNANLKVNMSQAILNFFDDTNNIDYISIKNDEDDKPVYYFVTGKKWIAENTIQLELYMDTVVTMNGNYEISEKTNIMRQHEDRFYKDGNNLIRIVDPVAEDLNYAYIKENETQVKNNNMAAEDNDKFYLIYVSETENVENSPVNCFGLFNNAVDVIGGYNKTFDGVEFFSGLGDDIRIFDYYLLGDEITTKEKAKITITIKPQGGNDKTFSIYYDGSYYYTVGFDATNNKVYQLKIKKRLVDNDLIVSKEGYDINLQNIYNNYVIDLRVEGQKKIRGYNTTRSYFNDNKVGSSTWEEFDLESGAIIGRLNSFEDFDRTDIKIIRIIELPYYPQEMTKNSGGFISLLNSNFILTTYDGLNILKLDNLNRKFTKDLYLEDVYDYMKITHTPNIYDASNINYESKLYNSNFYLKKFTYDSFNYLFKGEEADGYSKVSASFIPSSNFISKFAFMFDWNRKNTKEDYEKVLLVSRNNEVAIYNSSYLNYLRNGYNYDVKMREIQYRNTMINAGVNLGIGAAAAAVTVVGGGAFTATTAVSMIGSGVSTLINAEMAKANSEMAQKQKLEELREQGVNISGGDDLDLLNAYSNNKAKVITYSCSDNNKNALYELFRYYGYKSNKRGVPNVSSRYWYNFIQAEVELFTTTNISNEIEEDLKERYKKGITKFHYHAGKGTGGYNYDQDLENWEVSLNPQG